MSMVQESVIITTHTENVRCNKYLNFTDFKTMTQAERNELIDEWGRDFIRILTTPIIIG